MKTPTHTNLESSLELRSERESSTESSPSATPQAFRPSPLNALETGAYEEALGRQGFRLLTLHDVMVEESESLADSQKGQKKNPEGAGAEGLRGVSGAAHAALGQVIRAGAAQITLQRRDRQILETCSEQRFLLIEHIETHFFKGASKQAARKRVRELIQAGYLTRQKISYLSSRSLIRPTSKTLDLIKSSSPEKAQSLPHPRTRIDFNTLEHDSLVSHVRLWLEAHFSGFWVAEFALKNWKLSTIPDGIFFPESGEKWIVELENSIKAKERLRLLWNYWWRYFFASNPLIFLTLGLVGLHINIKSYKGPWVKAHITWGNVRSNGIYSPIILRPASTAFGHTRAIRSLSLNKTR